LEMYTIQKSSKTSTSGLFAYSFFSQSMIEMTYSQINIATNDQGSFVISA